MALAEFDRVSKKYGKVVALADFTLRVADGELITVLGPSGCGKSTLLRLTAGLDKPTSGEIRVGDRRIDTLPPHRRDVAMVFQSYALYPHMSVRRNIEFPLRMRRVKRRERRAQSEQLAAVLELTPLLDRLPAELSGGQRQRVALARALVRHPALFLLDEPLSNLDARLRLEVRQFVRDLQRRLNVTTLYVTHDQGEAMTLGDRVVVMRAGRIEQVDTPAAVYERPATAFVASFVGTPPMNVLAVRYTGEALRFAEHRVPLTAEQRTPFGPQPRTLLVGIRPEAFSSDPTATGLEVVSDPTSSEILGSETLVRATLGNAQVTARLPGIVRDVPRRLVAPFQSLHLFADDDTGARLDPD